MISLRAYDQAALMLAAEISAGTDVGARLDALFADPAVAFVQLHNAPTAASRARRIASARRRHGRISTT